MSVILAMSLPNPILEFTGVPKNQIYIGGMRDMSGVSVADVCLLKYAATPDEKMEQYKAICVAFTGSEKPKEQPNPISPGKIRYIPAFDVYAFIADPRCSLEQRAELQVKGTEQVIKIGEKYEVVKRPFLTNKRVKEFASTEPKGHAGIQGMQSQHPKRKNGRLMFNSVYGEKGNHLPEFSYTRDQMRLGRVPEEGSNLVFLYPESYEKAWEDTAQRRELERLGINSPDDLVWENAKEYRGFEWEAARINSNGKISNIIELEQKPSSSAPGLIIITIGKKGVSATSPSMPSEGVVGSTGAETQIGKYILEWDTDSLEKIEGSKDILKEIIDGIEKRKDNPAMQFGIETYKRDGAVKEFREIWEFNGWSDPFKMWNIPMASDSIVLAEKYNNNP